MLIIRTAQMEILGKQAWRNFLTSLCEEIQTSIKYSLSPKEDDLAQRIERIAWEGRSAGIREFADLRRLVILTFAHLPDPGHEPLSDGLRKMIADHRFSPATRIERLHTSFQAAEWRRKYPRRDPAKG
jgi:hypothetical protein